MCGTSDVRLNKEKTDGWMDGCHVMFLFLLDTFLTVLNPMVSIIAHLHAEIIWCHLLDS